MTGFSEPEVGTASAQYTQVWVQRDTDIGERETDKPSMGVYHWRRTGQPIPSPMKQVAQRHETEVVVCWWDIMS